MKLVKVIPITKSPTKELSYFSAKDVREGALVSIPLRAKIIPALVIESVDVKNNKTEIRRASYPLKRIKDVRAENFFSSEFVSACQKISRYFLAGTGNTIKELCPQAILENPPIVPVSTPSLPTREPTRQKSSHKLSLLRASEEELVGFYKNLIRTEFAQNQSVFLCVPFSQKTEKYKNELGKGIEQFTFVCHGSLTKKQQKEVWGKIIQEKHPVLIIATGLFLSIPRKDIGTIILDEESNPLYKNQDRPFLDIRVAAEFISRETQNSLIFADEILRVKTRDLEIKNLAAYAVPASSKIIGTAKITLVDTKPLKKSLSREMAKMLESACGKNEHTLIFLNRRGYELSTICEDCGRVLSCPNCDSPMVLHKNTEGGKKFVCHKCLSQTNASDKCPYCQSWKLVSFGMGIQKTAEEIKNLFPNFKIFQLDSDSIKNRKQGQNILDQFLSTSGAILLSTEILFSFYTGRFDNIGVVSVDGLFNLPDFGINEKIYRTLMRLKTRARKNMIIQTRLIDQPLFQSIINGDLENFYKTELKIRERFGYPPFKMLIKICCEGPDKQKIKKEIGALVSQLEEFEPISFPAFASKIKNKTRFYVLIKTENNTWPDKTQTLYKILSSLPLHYKIEIDPESLL